MKPTPDSIHRPGEQPKSTPFFRREELLADPGTYSRELFERSSLEPAPDSQLVDLLVEVSKCLKDEDLIRIFQAFKGFDKPVYRDGAKSEVERVEHPDLRFFVQKIPDYMQAAEDGGLSYDHAVGMVVDMLDLDKFKIGAPSLKLELLTRAFRASARHGSKLGEQVEGIKSMLQVGYEIGDMGKVLDSFSILMPLGLSPEQATQMILQSNGGVRGGQFVFISYDFNQALESMLPAKVNPDLVFEAFTLLSSDAPRNVVSDCYRKFREMMLWVCPKRGITPNEMLIIFLAKTKRDARVVNVLEGEVAEKLDESEIERSSKEKYFVKNDNGTLEHAAQPYQMKRSLSEGVQDLEKLAKADMWSFEEVAEGCWIFDPASEVWYSLGGETEMLPAGARHHFVPYDLSKLSDSPYFFHIHPEEGEAGIALSLQRKGFIFPELRDPLAKFLTATPSGADYGRIGEWSLEKQTPAKAFITHSLGTTEVIFPNDPAKLEKMKEESQGIRDQLMLAFDVDGYLTQRDLAIGDINAFDLVQELIKALNKKLPEGFELKLHPPGTDFTT